MPSLRRVSDGAGDSGSMSDIWRENPDTKQIEWEQGQRPRIGWGVRTGSLTGRSYSYQDYWTTTPVTEILEEKEDYIRFKTGNSEYEWTV